MPYTFIGHYFLVSTLQNTISKFVFRYNYALDVNKWNLSTLQTIYSEKVSIIKIFCKYTIENLFELRELFLLFMLCIYCTYMFIQLYNKHFLNKMFLFLFL